MTETSASDPNSASAPTASLFVERNSPKDVQNRQIYVRLDDQPLATLLYGRSVEQEIQPGTHTLLANNTWKKRKITFTLQPGQRAAFRVSSQPGWGYSLLVGFFGAAPMEVMIEPIERPAA